MGLLSLKNLNFFSLGLLFMLSSFATATEEPVSTLIIGGGIGGGTSALYLSRGGSHPVVIMGGTPGGALAKSNAVENWPGLMQIPGEELITRIREQAEEAGALFLDEEVIGVDFSKKPFVITTRSLLDPNKKRVFRPDSCIIATGATPNYLGVPGEKEYWGRGVTNCAICDGPLYKGKKVAVVGGGDSALLEALYLANLAEKVVVLVRKDHFKAVEEKRKEALLSLPNVKVFYQTVVEEIKGDGENVTGIRIKEGSQSHQIPVDGLFLAIGSKPNTSLFKGKIELDSHGYIVLKKGQETSVEGVYAIGDVSDPLDKQAISAAGDGAKAALAIQREVHSPVQLIEISSQEQFDKLLRTSTTPVLADFYALWCSPCKRITPKLESTAASLNGKVKILKINIDKNGELAKNYQIKSLPTVLLFKKGVLVDRKIGEVQISELLSQLIDESIPVKTSHLESIP